DLAVENSYWVKKSKLKNEILGTDLQTLYILEEADFLAKLDEFDQKQKELFETTTFTIEEFKDRESKNLKYHKELTLSRFGRYHSHFAQKPDFEVSETFPKADETIDYDNAEDFEFSGVNGAYGQLVANNVSKKVGEIYDKEVGENASFDRAKYDAIQLKIFKTTKTHSIKNGLAPNISYGINPANEMSEELYKELMANITDEIFKKELTEKFDKIK